MIIEKQDLDELNAELRIIVQPDDYKERVEMALKNYRKKAHLPGFRPGHVPVTLIKQRYGKSILAEEINKLIQDNIYRFIAENKIAVLGTPIPKNDRDEVGNWDNPGDFNFTYELGIAPQLQVKLDKSQTFTYYEVEITEDLITRQVKDMARRYGKMEDPETSGEEDMLICSLKEVDEKNLIKEHGIGTDKTTVSIEYIKDASTKSSLLGLKVGDNAIVNPLHLAENHDDLAQMLGISHSDVHHLKCMVQLSVLEIKRIIPHELNQELFDKLYGKDNVQNEEMMREKTREQLQHSFAKDSEYLFQRNAKRELVKRINPQLPDEFLKRFIMLTNEKPLTAEIVDYEYPKYAWQLKWDLIETHLLKELNLKIEKEDLLQYVKTVLAERYAQYGLPAMDEEMLMQMAERALSKKEDEEQAYKTVCDNKLMQAIKEHCTVENVRLNLENFIHQLQH